MRQAKIDCPHCGKPITVRDKPSVDYNWNEINEELNKMWKAVEKSFREIFKK